MDGQTDEWRDGSMEWQSILLICECIGVDGGGVKILAEGVARVRWGGGNSTAFNCQFSRGDFLLIRDPMSALKS